MFILNSNSDTTITRLNLDLFYKRVPRFCGTNLSYLSSYLRYCKICKLTKIYKTLWRPIWWVVWPRRAYILGYLKGSNAVAHSVDIKRIENDIECVQFACWKVIITISLQKKSWERCLENDQMVINFGFPQ